MVSYPSGFFDGFEGGGSYGFWAGMRLSALFSVILSCLAAGCSASSPYKLSIVEQNDALTAFNGDEYYTQGLELKLNNYDKGREIALGQQIFTPDNKRTSELIENDRPYAGFLYARYSQDVIKSPETVDQYSITGGLVGQGAGGRWTQNNFHDLIDNNRVKGWSNQLENEPILNLKYEQSNYGWFNAFGTFPLSTRTYYGGSLGNFLTGSHVGTRLDRARDIGPVTVSLFSGIEGAFNLWDITLDGNTFKDSHSVDKNRFVATAFWGVGAQYERFFIEYQYLLITEQFEEQKAGGHNFGSIQIGMRG